MKQSHWVIFSLTINGLLLLAIAYLWQQEYKGQFFLRSWQSSEIAPSRLSSLPSGSVLAQSSTPKPELGERHYLNYQQWIDVLKQEAEFAAQDQPENLVILLGDSISLWFPPELLPPQTTWLNQGISGDTSLGVLRRLDLFDRTQPKAIFLMIGINDLLKEIRSDTIVANQRLIIRYLKRVHPDTQIVVQSILPHSDKKATWEGRDRLLKIPNPKIQEINRQLELVAQEEEVLYLDLYPLFADEQDNLQMQFSTDGLHLNPQGYQVWRTALLLFSDLQFD